MRENKELPTFSLNKTLKTTQTVHCLRGFERERNRSFLHRSSRARAPTVRQSQSKSRRRERERERVRQAAFFKLLPKPFFLRPLAFCGLRSVTHCGVIHSSICRSQQANIEYTAVAVPILWGAKSGRISPRGSLVGQFSSV